MKVLLTADVAKLGKAGQVKTVADGFGRNYLLPRGLAVLATAGAMKQAEDIRRSAEKKQERERAEAAALADRISQVELHFTARAGSSGKLYGSITAQDIATALSQQLGTEIDRRKIEAEHLREVGEHQVTVRLSAEAAPQVKITVRREGEPEVTPAAPVATEAPAA